MEFLKMFFPCLMEHPLMFLMTLIFIWTTVFGVYAFVSAVATLICHFKEKKRQKESVLHRLPLYYGGNNNVK